MDASEQIRLVQSSVERWNEWRRESPGVRPNLAGVELVELDLSGVDFSDTDLARANLERSTLDGSDLSGADLTRASLQRSRAHKARFVLTDLIKTDLTRANLVAADLSSADLSGAILRDADLTDANLTEAGMAATLLCGTKLPMESLDSIRHFDRSFLDPSTLVLSPGAPEAFLRGCGWAEWLIRAWHEASVGEEEYYSCFISHSSGDIGFARQLYQSLQARGVRCWFAPHDMPIGARLRETIEEMVHHHDKLLLICSADSLASPWVEDEVEAALEREVEEDESVLIPIRIDDRILKIKAGWAARLRRTRNIADFLNWSDRMAYQDALERLMSVLRR